jgi:hypothetical protein
MFGLLALFAVGFALFGLFLVALLVKLAFRVVLFPLWIALLAFKVVVLGVMGLVVLAVVGPVLLVIGAVAGLPLLLVGGVAWLVLRGLVQPSAPPQLAYNHAPRHEIGPGSS